MSEYYTDYPTEPIGGGNPYYRCKYCKVSDPEINGKLKRHSSTCEYRRIKELENKLNEYKVEVHCHICKKQMQPEDDIYWDGYFGGRYCSWPCTVEAMAEFFEVREGNTIKLKETD